jgi:hypothetical protein
VAGDDQHLEIRVQKRSADTMNSIDRYRSTAVGLVQSRQLGRALARIEDNTAVQVAQVDAVADIQAAQVDAVAAVAQRAMQGVAFVSQIEQQLGQAVPIAVTRLQAVGDLATLAMGQVVTDSMTKLRRY